AVIVYIARFAITLIHREVVRPGHAGLASEWEQFAARGPIVEPLVLDRHIDRYSSGSRRLTAVAAHYGVPVSHEDADGAAAAALAAARVACVIAQHTPKIAELTPAALHKPQAEAAAEQATSYADYLRTQGQPVDDVHLEWPLIPTRKEET